MDKSSSIKAKSGRFMVNANRWLLKFAFAFAVLSAVVVLFVGLDFTDPTLVFSTGTSVVFALAYAICYYLYKFYNKTKTEMIKKDPLLGQIRVMCHVISFIVGLILICLGADLVHQGKMWGILLLFGIIFCQGLLVSNQIMSHLSTFFENLSAGVLLGYTYIALTLGLDYYCLLAFGITLICLVLLEVFYYFFDIKKHDLEDMHFRDLLRIRAKYFARNALIFFILYIIIALLVYTDMLRGLLASDFLNALLQALPIIISIVSIVLAYVDTGKRKNATRYNDYNAVLDIDAYRTEFVPQYGENFAKALDFVTQTMNKESGYSRSTGEDYFYHCVNVANILYSAGKIQEDLMCAALLHDCIEDIPNCTEADITKLTNKSVAHSVVLVSKKADVDYHIDANLCEYLDTILSDENATLVKTADRMHNVTTLKNVSKQKYASKIAETQKAFIPFLTKAKTIYPQHFAFFNEVIKYFENLR